MEITFLDAKDKNSLFIDIRSAYKYLQGTIPGSINIVENIILLNPEKYLKKEIIMWFFVIMEIEVRKLVII